jgi:biotin operon repressor
MKVRGFDGTVMDKQRISELRERRPGTFSIVPVAPACDRRLGRCSALHVLVVLGHFANADTGDCFPSIKRISRMLGITRRAVQQHINTLIEYGYLVAKGRRRLGGGRSTNEYVLLFAAVQKAALDELNEGGVQTAADDPNSRGEAVMPRKSNAKTSFAYPTP